MKKSLVTINLNCETAAAMRSPGSLIRAMTGKRRCQEAVAA
jgi:hypothetical protein